jgi:hypothetical protein
MARREMTEHEKGPGQAIELAGRHRIEVHQEGDGHVVRLVIPDGSTPISIEVTSRGVVLKIDGPGIALQASGALSLSADRLSLRGRQGVEIASDGDLQLAVAGELHSHAAAHVVRAERGCVDVKASDDVRLSGERVMVNCDETVQRYYREPPALTPPEPAPKALSAAPEQTPANKPG